QRPRGCPLRRHPRRQPRAGGSARGTHPGHAHNFQQHPDAAQMFYDNPAYVSSAPELERVRAEARANDRLWTATIDEALAAGKLRSDVDPKQLKVMLRNMIWSTTRGLRRGRTAKRDHADGVVKLLLHGCLLADS
ncbi:MAG: hypothetical protein AB7V43_22705, partial [Acidimicrobiia bacterium]